MLGPRTILCLLMSSNIIFPAKHGTLVIQPAPLTALAEVPDLFSVSSKNYFMFLITHENHVLLVPLGCGICVCKIKWL